MIEYCINSLCNAGLLLLYGIVPWLIAALILQVISNSVRTSLARMCGIKTYIYATFPGVMLHELSHAFFCIVFRHKIVEMKLFSPEEDGTLGYVNHQYNPKSVYQRAGNFFIGTGPIWGGVAAILFLTHLLLPQLTGNREEIIQMISTFDFWKSYKPWLWLYCTFTAFSHMTLSPPDLRGAADGLVMLITVTALSCLAFGWYGEWEIRLLEWMKLFQERLLPIFGTFIMISLAVAGILIIIRPKERENP